MDKPMKPANDGDRRANDRRQKADPGYSAEERRLAQRRNSSER